MQKTPAYHEAAIQYNEGLAEAAEDLAPSIEHDEVKKWCVSVGKQHRFHAKRHRSALNKLLVKQEAPPVETIADGLDVPDLEEDESLEPLEPPSEMEPAPDEDDAEHLPQADTQLLEDGCETFHNPQLKTCEFHSKMNISPPKENFDG